MKTVRKVAVAVVGGGWAGCAAAVELASKGHQVTLFEAARTLGGRAREVELKPESSTGRGSVRVDNGQHILLGAYSATLRLIKQVGLERKQVFLNLPLQMRYPPDSGGMDFIAPRWPAPLHLAGALLRAKGLAWADKMALARFSSSARWMGWHLHTDCSVSELLERFDQTPRLIQLMWRPLCLAALNTPPERASAKVFLNVLRDSLGAKRSASDMLLPKVDLSALFPDAAANYVKQHGGAVRLGAKVSALRQAADGGWQIEIAGTDGGMHFERVILATPAAHTAALMQKMSLLDPAVSKPAVVQLVTQLSAFEAEAITTCYLQYDASVKLALPFFALIDQPQQQQWGQFVFDRGQLNAAQAGLLAVVVSASGEAAQLKQSTLADALAQQLARVFQRPELAVPLWCQVITEKRATYACTPNLLRPQNATRLAGLAIAGDFTAGEYPATIESAVRSGILAAGCV